MIKFVLIMHLCSQITGNCFSQKLGVSEYADYYSCVRDGYLQSYKSLDALPVEEINTSKLAVRFECIELKIETT